MSQTKNNATFKKLAVALALSVLAITSFSCAKKAAGVRGQVKKTSNINMNPGVTAQAEQTAAAQRVLYKIASISTPVVNADGSASVSFELLTPANQYLPFTTTHVASALTRQGVYNDTANGVQVSIQAKCTTTDCGSFYLLVGVAKNNAILFQTGAVSYASDASFYGISVTNNFNSVEALQSYVATTAYATPRNDLPAEDDSSNSLW